MLQGENSWQRGRKNGRVENLRQAGTYSNHTNRNRGGGGGKWGEKRSLKPRVREPLGTPKSKDPLNTLAHSFHPGHYSFHSQAEPPSTTLSMVNREVASI